MKRSPVVTVLFVVAAAITLLHVARFALPNTGLGSAAAERPLLIIAAWTKLACLAMATSFASRCVRHLERGNLARAPWIILTAGLAAFTMGQATLTYYQTVFGVSPFPSIADFWFAISYPLLIVALVAFWLAYARSGFAMGGLTTLAAALTAGICVLAWPLLRPIAMTPAKPLATVLNVAYPALDLILLIPTVVLLRLTSRFRGGAVWRLWAALLTGFVFVALGDLAFAYFSILNYTRLDPLIHALYVIAYASLAAGTRVQYEMLAPETPILIAVPAPSRAN